MIFVEVLIFLEECHTMSRAASSRLAKSGNRMLVKRKYMTV